MKRDNDLIRKILLKIEEHNKPDGWMDIEIEKYSHEVISYHIQLLDNAGFINAKNLSNKTTGHDWRPVKLTWEGHEFLDAARNEKIWAKAKKEIGKNFFTVPIEVLKKLLMNIVLKELGF